MRFAVESGREATADKEEGPPLFPKPDWPRGTKQDAIHPPRTRSGPKVSGQWDGKVPGCGDRASNQMPKCEPIARANARAEIRYRRPKANRRIRNHKPAHRDSATEKPQRAKGMRAG